VTWTLYGLYAVYGFFLYAFGPSVPLLRDEQRISDTLAGLHGTALACGTVVAGMVGERVVHRWGRRRILWASVAGLCAGVVVLCGPAITALTLAGAVVAGAFGSTLINVDGAALAEHHGPAAPPALSEANASGSGVGLLAPLLIGAAVSLGLGWRTGMLVLLPFAAGVALFGWRAPIPDPPRAATTETSGRGGRLSTAFWWTWVALVLCVALEFCLTIWCSDVLEQRTGLSSGVAATGVAAVVVGLTVGRLAGSPLTQRREPAWLLVRSIGLYLAGFAVFWTSTIAWLSFAGLFVCGLGLALLFPLSLVRALAFSDRRPDLAMARSALGAGLAVGVGPFVLGALADVVGTHRAFLIVPGLAAAAVAGVALGGRAAAREGRSVAA
jgi:predicted MFS family arabinose efflux permease